jgi:beta-glucanase (GH16 family)
MIIASSLLLLLLTSSAAPRTAAPGHQRAPTSFCAAHGFRQVWSDEFNGAGLNSSNWEKRTMGKVDRMAAVEDDDIYLENGSLVLRSQRRAVSGYNFTSGALHTRGKHSWKGRTRVCVRARLPAGGLGRAQGIQPAHWMMPETAACWPSNGEIDIMEMFNGNGQAFGTYIWKRHGCNQPDSADGKPTEVIPDFDRVFHEYAVEYDGVGRVTFAFDGVPFNVVTHAAFFDVPYYMILDTSIGSKRAGAPNASTVFPAYHYIDWVRVAKLAP